MINFKIDNRENCKTKFPAAILENLPLGDFLFEDDENNVLLIIERKTISDLVSSIIDGRYHEQKDRLLSNYEPSKIMYIIEGNIVSNTKVNILSAMIGLTVRDRITVLCTNNLDETIIVLNEIYKKLQKGLLTSSSNTLANSMKIHKTTYSLHNLSIRWSKRK